MISDASRSSRPGGSLPAIILFRALRRTSYRGGGKFANPLSAVNVRCPNMGLRRRTDDDQRQKVRSEEHTSELQSLMRISYAVFCLKKKNQISRHLMHQTHIL